MIFKPLGIFMALLSVMLSFCSGASVPKKVFSPIAGVVCDGYFCANAEGISTPLTSLYLGQEQASRLEGVGEFNRMVFTYANGVYCDIKTKQCRKDRYFDADGNPSGTEDVITTRLLFGYRLE